MPIIRKQSTGFTQVSNAVLNDKRLSLKAKGLYSFIFSKPDGWEFEAKRISKQSRDGRDSVLSGLRELEKNGYLIRKKLDDGRIEYHLLNRPKTENPTLGKSHCGKTRPISNKDFNSNKELNSNTELLAKETFAEEENNENDIKFIEKEKSKEIAEIINVFKKLNPLINFGNKTFRQSAIDLINEFGFEKAKNTAEYAVYIQEQGEKYAPLITNPAQLKNKLGSLKAFRAKELSSEQAFI